LQSYTGRVPVVGDALLLKETANPTVLTSKNSECRPMLLASFELELI
jgi:hypothetical protein